MDNNGKRDSFGSQFGLIMAAVGSAVGLGNIWRFSYMTGMNGGGAFLLIYILCVFLVGVPVLVSEFVIGRKSELSPISAYKKLSPKTPWWLAGIPAVVAPTMIMFYYPVIAGWSLGYVVESITNFNSIIADSGAAFTAFSSGGKAFIFALLALLITAVINMGGIAGGIEKANKILMPTLALILVVLVVRSCTLPGAFEGVKFLFVPDFSKLTMGGVLDALGHSFFSLSLGMGIMVTYASYMKKEADLNNAAMNIIFMDTGIALLAGLAIFPAVFALGIAPDSGVGLCFITLPGAFAQMPVGWLFSALFFLLLFVAALTSMMSLMQVPVAFLQDEMKLSKNKSIGIVTALLLVCGIPSVLSFSTLADFHIFGMNYFDFMDAFSNNILLPVTGLLGCIFIGYKFGIKNALDEFMSGSGKKSSIITKVYPVCVKFMAPIAIVIILLNATGLFSKIFGG